MLGPIGAVLKGDNVSLNCSIEEGSTPEIHWSKDNLTRSEKGRMLHLTKVKAEDEGCTPVKQRIMLVPPLAKSF